jgi:hypothetical protein
MRLTTKMTGLALVALIGLGATSKANSITYDFVNYGSLQNGYSLSGTITTNGTIGELDSSEISSWTFTLTKGSTTITKSSTDPEAYVVIVGDVEASSTAITMAIPEGYTQLEFTSDYLLYDRFNVPEIESYDTYESSGQFTNDTNDGNTLTLGENNPWTIATATAVPEPSSIVTAGIAVASGMVVAVRRRSKRAADPLG